MKKSLFCTAVFFIMSIGCFAQQEHMKVLGIDINGPYETFIRQVQTKGFVYDFEEDAEGGYTETKVVWYKGRFMGEMATLCAYQSRSGNVWSVVIVIDDYHYDRSLSQEIIERWRHIIETFDSKYLSNKIINSTYPSKIRDNWMPLEVYPQMLKKSDGSYYGELYRFDNTDGTIKGGIRVIMQARTKSIIIIYTDTKNAEQAYREFNEEF